MAPVVVMPIRHFDGFTRLTDAVPGPNRRRLATELADRMRRATVGAGLHLRVVTADPAVASWGEKYDVDVHSDSGAGLNAACATATADLDSWLVVHADLPGVDASTVARIGSMVTDGVVIAPSADGGTNAIGAPHRVDFAFGPSSFHQHLAAHPTAAVLVDPRLAVEVDTPVHLANVPAAWRPSSLDNI